MKKILFIIISLLIISIWRIWSSDKNKSAGNSAGSGKIQITASFYPLYYLGKAIGGDRVIVYNLTPSGSEPHDYEPSPRDIAGIEKGDILLLNGGGVESWGEKMKSNLRDKKTAVIEAGSGLFNQTGAPGNNAVVDPHVWLSPRLYKKEALVVLNSLIYADSKNKDYYQGQADKLTAKLDSLDSLYREGLKDCKKKDIITSHDSFSYLAKAYGLNQVSLTGLSPESEPSQSQMMEIVNYARAQKVKYIFFESLASPKIAETIAGEIGAGMLVLDPLEGMTGDEMKKDSDYFSVMENNLKNIKLALECRN